MTRFVLPMVPLLLALVMVSQAFADPPEPTRVIVLEPVDDSPYLRVFRNKPPTATFRIWFWGNSQWVPNAALWVKGLAHTSGDGQAYAFYYTTRSRPEEYVHGEYGSGRFTFNMGYPAEIYAAFGVPGLTDNPPTITCFIAVEDDDGRSFMPHLDMEKVVFVGTSVLD